MKLLFLLTEDWAFVSHRLPLARAARDAGAEMFVMTHLSDLRFELEREGFTIIPWEISRSSINPFREVSAFLQVIRAYRRVRPDLLFHVGLKPVAYGGLAARLCDRTASVNAIAGMGHAFTSSNRRMQLLRQVLLTLLRLALGGKNTKVVLQNDENRALLIKEGVVPLSRTTVIRGTGVNVDQFVPRPEPVGTPVVLLASRLLWEKGIGEFVEAARQLRTRSINARFVLVGKPDPENPASISEARIHEWVDSSLIEWWGHQDDMAKVLTRANIVCLPSYAEGLPRVLVEAASCGRPIVTSDIPGCHDIVRQGENGLLVPIRNPDALARAIEILISDRELRARMGARGREIVIREFDERIVIAQMLSVFKETAGARWPAFQSEVPGIRRIASSCTG
ncbi:MAG TPA: glycosyltransferase family 4 protein [Candidatus Sulfotelmatobacter sp.]|nr:glycosyltransferase family 4 protein [Candidatus Sulfotelmatobacter sp.]